MFFFFSNRMGCLGSIVVSLIITGIILAVLGIFWGEAGGKASSSGHESMNRKPFPFEVAHLRPCQE